MYNPLRNRRIMLAVIFMLCCGSALLASSFVWAEETIQSVKLKAEGLPQTWTLISEYVVPQNQLLNFEAKFVVALHEMLNQVITVGQNEHEIRVNYVRGTSEFYSSEVYRQLITLVGMQNTIVRKENVIIEVIAEEPGLKQAVLDLLDLSYLQRYKLTADNVPQNWRLTEEFYSYGDELIQFEEKFGVQDLEVINQLFLTDQQRVRVNSVACDSQEDAERVFRKLDEMVGQQNLVVKNNRLVFEVITQSDDLKRQLEDIINSIQ